MPCQNICFILKFITLKRTIRFYQTCWICLCINVIRYVPKLSSVQLLVRISFITWAWMCFICMMCVCAHARRLDCVLAPRKCHASTLPTSRKLHKFARLFTVWSYFWTWQPFISSLPWNKTKEKQWHKKGRLFKRRQIFPYVTIKDFPCFPLEGQNILA